MHPLEGSAEFTCFLFQIKANNDNGGYDAHSDKNKVKHSKG